MEYRGRWIKLWIALTVAGACLSTPLQAQGWKPTRNIEFIVSSGAGGAADREARELQKHLQKLPGMVSIVVNNRPGGGGSIAWTSLNQHLGDAHWISTMNVALLSNHILGVTPLHYRDLTPLAMLMREHIAVWTHLDSPIKSARELITRLKANPASISFGFSPALGNQNHIVLGMLAKAAGVDPKALKIVVYSSGGNGIPAALGGHVDAWLGTLGGAIPLATSGRVNVMGISAERRQPGRAVAMPTFREQGIDAVYAGYRGLVGPGGLSSAQRAYWDATLATVVNSDGWKQSALDHAWEPDYKNSAEARKHLDNAYPALQRILYELGVKK